MGGVFLSLYILFIFQGKIPFIKYICIVKKKYIIK